MARILSDLARAGENRQRRKFSGFATAVNAAQRGAMDTGFTAIPLGSVVVFPALVGAALLYRRQTDIHKRLILIDC